MTDTDTSRETPALADQVAEAYLRASRWGNYRVRAELEDGSAVWVQCKPGPADVIYVEDTETGHGADFRLQVRAVQLPAAGPESDGAWQAELADAQRHAMTPGPEGKSPADLILDVVAKARALARSTGWGFSAILPGPESELVAALDGLDLALQAEAREMHGPDATESGHWHPTTWGDTTTVKGGARVRVGGQHEATVETVVVATWLGSGATTLQVKLEGRDQPYKMPPSGPVEVWTPALPDWAGQAFLTLAAAFGEVDPRG